LTSFCRSDVSERQPGWTSGIAAFLCDGAANHDGNGGENKFHFEDLLLERVLTSFTCWNYERISSVELLKNIFQREKRRIYHIAETII